MTAPARSPAPLVIHREDYRPPRFVVDTVDLDIQLDPELTQVRARLHLRRQSEADDQPLRLCGEGLTLLEIRQDGQILASDQYRLEEGALLLLHPSRDFVLETLVQIRPVANTALSGLYFANGHFITQCEAEGFRRITYYLDRPDVLARFTATLHAEQVHYPVLLANGNRMAAGQEADGRHWVRWEDPFPKPCYLFALVAGDLGCVRDHFRTASGREVALEIYVEAHHLDACAQAMDALKRAMAWDERVYGREYDLDRYMIVATDTFNMGAMENKGLNIFNSKYVLARPETATDTDYQGIESVIAHEYFHNWTGNRVTLRDWFQLSLKEGLTVFRDQEFSADENSRGVQRIGDVRRLRAAQFPEDAGPLAHPVRPDAYIEINNFYTATVYEKGAEVVRMIHTVLGAAAFRQGMDLYFSRHDGQAVTIEDFLAAMEGATGKDLAAFRFWYSQAGTPVLHAAGQYDPAQKRYSLTLRQETAPTPGQPEKQPLPIPVRMALLSPEGQAIPLRGQGGDGAGDQERILILDTAQQTWIFTEVSEAPIPSLLRGFSAPVRLEIGLDDAQRAFLASHDDDPFNRWEAMQGLALQALLAAIDHPDTAEVLPELLHGAMAAALSESRMDPAYRAELLTLPSEDYVGEQMVVIDVDGIHRAREALRRAMGSAFGEQWAADYENLAFPYSRDGISSGRRRLRNLALAYLLASDASYLARTRQQYRQADNMTDHLAAFSLLVHQPDGDASDILADFYRRWQQHPLVIDKWFAIQASAPRPDTLARVRALLQHPAFDWRTPNRVRALLGSFGANATAFHTADGSGYAFLATQIRHLDELNPQIAARLVTPLSRWQRYDAQRQALMRHALQDLAGKANLSRDLGEVLEKSLKLS
ncbi:MAG: aminopeptidase N [Acidithiobacillus sp.]